MNIVSRKCSSHPVRHPSEDWIQHLGAILDAGLRRHERNREVLLMTLSHVEIQYFRWVLDYRTIPE